MVETVSEPKHSSSMANKVFSYALLDSLLILDKRFGQNTSNETILSGLPINGKQLPLNLFNKAAERCGLSARTVKLPLDKLDSENLPVVLLLENEQSCVVSNMNGSSGEAVFEVVQNDPQASVSQVSYSELAEQYSGYSVLTREQHQLSQRTAEFDVKESKHWFWSVIRSVWKSYGEVLVASFLVNLFAVAAPLFVMNVYDRVVPNNAMETLWVLSIGMLIVISFEFIMRTLRGYYIDKVGRKIDLILSAKTFAQVLGLNMAERPNSVGSLANTMQSFESFREFITSATISLLVDLPFSLLFIAVIALLSPMLALVPLIAVPMILGMSLLLQKPIQHLVQKSYRYSAEKQALLVETIAASEAIKCLNAEGEHQKKWEEVTGEASKIGLKVRRLVNYGMNFAISMQFLSLVSIVIVGVYAIESGHLSIGGLIACTILNGRALAPIVQVASLLTRYKQSRAALNALDSIMQKATDRPEGTSYINLPAIKGGIEFKDVEFFYPGESIPALSHISFKLNPGDKVGIIGATGSGKSTLAKLILKLYRPTSGHVLIDDVDVNQIDPAFLRNNVGYIPQQVTLFHGSVRDNIMMAARHAGDEAMLEAAKLSSTHQFVNTHPDGYDRQVGERGSLLSGGQQQCIAIARALLLDPKVYLFDEPTSFLDNVRAARFLKQLEPKIKDRTLVVVTHKANVLDLVDHIIVMDAGKIAAYGPKDEVLARLKNKQP